MSWKKTYQWNSKVLMGLLIIGMSCLLFACSEDAEQDMQEDDTLQLMPYSRNFSYSGQLFTRIITGYESYTAAPIAAYMTPEGISRVTTYRYSTITGRWNSGFKIKDGHNYCIYGFTPSNAVTGSSINSSNYANGAQLTLNGLISVSDKDICIIVGIKQVDTANAPEPEDFLPGRFLYEGRDKNQNFAYMMLHHIYAALSFTMKVEPEYNLLRTIKLKKMELKGVPVTYNTVTIPITANTTGDNPINNITWVSSSETNDIQFFEHAGLELTTVAQPLTLELNANEIEKIVVAPDLTNSLTLCCTYDVYDKKGNLIREDCTAENKLPNGVVRQGEWKTVNLTVNPTYLYVLSDPDLDNPTFIVEN